MDESRIKISYKFGVVSYELDNGFYQLLYTFTDLGVNFNTPYKDIVKATQRKENKKNVN